MFKMINAKKHLTKTARNAFKGAFIAGGANEMIVFPNAYANDRKFKRITALMESLNIAWSLRDEDVYVIRRWFIEAVSDRSEAALTEAKNLIN